MSSPAPTTFPTHPWDILQALLLDAARAADPGLLKSLLEQLQVLGRTLYGELGEDFYGRMKYTLLIRVENAKLRAEAAQREEQGLESILCNTCFWQVDPINDASYDGEGEPS